MYQSFNSINTCVQRGEASTVFVVTNIIVKFINAVQKLTK